MALDIFARLGDNPSGEEGREPDDAVASADTGLRADSASRAAARRAATRAGRPPREIAAADSADCFGSAAFKTRTCPKNERMSQRLIMLQIQNSKTKITIQKIWSTGSR